jgi:hypothetical protein
MDPLAELIKIDPKSIGVLTNTNMMSTKVFKKKTSTDRRIMRQLSRRQPEYSR